MFFSFVLLFNVFAFSFFFRNFYKLCIMMIFQYFKESYFVCFFMITASLFLQVFLSACLFLQVFLSACLFLQVFLSACLFFYVCLFVFTGVLIFQLKSYKYKIYFLDFFLLLLHYVIRKEKTILYWFF